MSEAETLRHYSGAVIAVLDCQGRCYEQPGHSEFSFDGTAALPGSSDMAGGPMTCGSHTEKDSGPEVTVEMCLFLRAPDGRGRE